MKRYRSTMFQSRQSKNYSVIAGIVKKHTASHAPCWADLDWNNVYIRGVWDEEPGLPGSGFWHQIENCLWIWVKIRHGKFADRHIKKGWSWCGRVAKTPSSRLSLSSGNCLCAASVHVLCLFVWVFSTFLPLSKMQSVLATLNWRMSKRKWTPSLFLTFTVIPKKILKVQKSNRSLYIYSFLSLPLSLSTHSRFLTVLYLPLSLPPPPEHFVLSLLTVLLFLHLCPL